MTSNLTMARPVLAALLVWPFMVSAPGAFAPAAMAAPRQYLKKPDAWYAGDEASRIAANILSYQSDLGGWPKNIDTTAALFKGDRKELTPTFDNDATTDELGFLAHVYNAHNDERYRQPVR